MPNMNSCSFSRSFANVTVLLFLLSSLSLASPDSSKHYHWKRTSTSCSQVTAPSAASSGSPSVATSTIQNESLTQDIPPSLTNASDIISTGSISNVSSKGQFWAGADIGTLERAENITGRVFYDYDGTTVKDPIETLADSGVNAARVETNRGQCLGPTTFTTDSSTLSKELIYQNDFGCIDVQVHITQRAIAEGMRIILVINQGFNIPPGMESYTYAQMVIEVQKEARRQLLPFLTASIIPDVILFENEGTDGFLFNDTAGHTRGADDGKVSTTTLNSELCGQIPTGNIASYPQYAGYLKASILACNSAITAAKLSPTSVRYGLHSHAQYVDWKESVVHGPTPLSDTALLGHNSAPCPQTAESIIGAQLLSQNVSTMLTIAGFSAYPDPMTPSDPSSATSQLADLARPLHSISLIQSYAEAYGRYTSGPFMGQYKLQALGVEWATSYDKNSVEQEQQLTELLWEKVKQFECFLGMLWWEPWYCYNDWEGGMATLCSISSPAKGVTGETPTDAMRTWGRGAVSPWKN